MGLLDPLLQLVDVKVVLFGLEWGLQTDVKDPILFVTATSNKVDCLACL